MGRKVSLKKKLRQDSRGFTLVELMLTIAILAVISIPLISYFTDAAKHNAQSRLKQNATVAAQSVLEEFKDSSYSLDNYNTVCLSAPDWSIKTMPAAPGGKYTVTRNLKVDRHSFTVDAEITPIKGVATTGGITAIDYKRAVIGTMDTDKDVLASDNGLAYQSAQLFFSGKYTEECAKISQTADNAVVSAIPSKLSCTIEVTATANGAGENADVIMKVDYVYKYCGGSGGSSTTTDGINLSGEYRESVATSSIVAKNLNNIYIFYDPVKPDLPSVNGETIVFKSNIDFDSNLTVKQNQLKLFVIAQSSVPAGKPTPTGFVNRAVNYQLSFLSDTSLGAPANSFSQKIAAVYTNLSQNPQEIASNGDTMFGKLKTAAGSTDYTLVDTEDINRLAKIDVTVRHGTKTYATVTGSKVQN